jgi:hypothetical protein
MDNDNKLIPVFDMLIERLTNLEQKNDLLQNELDKILNYSQFFPNETTIRWIKFLNHFRINCCHPVMNLPVHIKNKVFNIINPCDNTEFTVVVRDDIIIRPEGQKEFADALLDVLPKPFLIVDRPMFPCHQKIGSWYSDHHYQPWQDALSDVEDQIIIGTLVWDKSMMKGADKLKDDIQYSAVQLVKGITHPFVFIWEIRENHYKASRFVLEKKCEGFTAPVDEDKSKMYDNIWIKLRL